MSSDKSAGSDDTVRYLLDECSSSRALLAGLKSRSVDVVSVPEVALRGAEDPQVLEWATECGRLVVTYDPDFLRLAAHRQDRGENFAGIVMYQPKKLSIGRLIQQLELVAGAAARQELWSSVLHLPL